MFRKKEKPPTNFLEEYPYLDPKAAAFLQMADEKLELERLTLGDVSMYGHALGGLIGLFSGYAEKNQDHEKQMEYLRQRALALIEKFGKDIIPFLRDELRLVLTDADLESIEK